MLLPLPSCLFLFFFNDTATTEIYTLSLHDALPICGRVRRLRHRHPTGRRSRHHDPIRRDVPLSDGVRTDGAFGDRGDRKSTRLNSSHLVISYAVFCLKKKKNTTTNRQLSNTATSPY